MRILYITQYFYPEMGAASARVHELSKYWVRSGHKVTVLTCYPNYPDGIVYENYKLKSKNLIYREEIDGINVIRVITFPTHLRNAFRRALNYITFFLSSLITAPFLKGFDIIIATSPPLFTGLSGLVASRTRGTPIVVEVRDLWPEVIASVGAASKNSLSYRIFNKIASILYEKSDLIVALTESFREEIISRRSVNHEKIKVVENGVDTEFFKPFHIGKEEIKSMGLQDKFIVSYIGTVGYTHGVEVILKAAPELAVRLPNLLFIIVGGGSDIERLRGIKNKGGLENVVFIERQPKGMILKYINASDISLVLSSRESLFHKTIFAKVFEPMACGKPIIVGAYGETRKLVVERADAGIAFEPESTNGLIEAITKLHQNPGMRKNLGQNGLNFVNREFSRSLKAQEYLQFLDKVVDDSKHREF